ncbi:MAG: C1 family peptidase [Flavobacteriales bacterium]|nr:C1 family peptidase [Flavobacteriales bacterium]
MSFRSACILLFGALPYVLSAQGLNWNAEAFQRRERIQPTRDDLPPSASLKRYAPYTHYQYGSTCVAFSLATARTILEAKAKGLTDKDAISANSFSPWFIYYRNRAAGDVGCSKGLDPDKAIADVLNNGVQHLMEVEYGEYYPFTDKLLTDYYPPSYSTDVKEASDYRLDAAYRLESIDDIRVALANGMPVIIGMMPPDSFTAQIGKPLWEPRSDEEPKPENAHALVVLGYDDSKNGGAIEVLNSWGKEWGQGGYIWIRYEDALRFTAGAYALEAGGGQRFKQAPQVGGESATIPAQESAPEWKGVGDFSFQCGSPATTQAQFKALKPGLNSK